MWKRPEGADQGIEREVAAKRTQSAQPARAAAVPVQSRPSGREADPPESTGVVNVGKSVVIKGELAGSEDVMIEGRFEGKIVLKDHDLTIGPNGRITAELSAKSIFVLGKGDRQPQGRRLRGHPRERFRRGRHHVSPGGHRRGCALPRQHRDAERAGAQGCGRRRGGVSQGGGGRFARRRRGGAEAPPRGTVAAGSWERAPQKRGGRPDRPGSLPAFALPYWCGRRSSCSRSPVGAGRRPSRSFP